MAAKSYPTCSITSSLPPLLDKTLQLSGNQLQLFIMDLILMHSSWFFKFQFKSNHFRRNHQLTLITTLMYKCNQGRSLLLTKWRKDLSLDRLGQAPTCSSKLKLLLFLLSRNSRSIKDFSWHSKKEAKNLYFQPLQ